MKNQWNFLMTLLKSQSTRKRKQTGLLKVDPKRKKKLFQFLPEKLSKKKNGGEVIINI